MGLILNYTASGSLGFGIQIDASNPRQMNDRSEDPTFKFLLPLQAGAEGRSRGRPQEVSTTLLTPTLLFTVLYCTIWTYDLSQPTHPILRTTLFTVVLLRCG